MMFTRLFQVGFFSLCWPLVNICLWIVDNVNNVVSGRIPFFVLAALVNLAAMLTMLFWSPVNKSNIPVFFVLAAMWGISDAVWQTQINGNY